MVTKVMPRVMEYLNAQNHNVRKGQLKINNEVAKIAQQQFYHNYNINRFFSVCSPIAGVVSVLAFSASLTNIFKSPIHAVGLALSSYILGKFCLNHISREGTLLDITINLEDEESVIDILSQGADIHKLIWPSWPLRYGKTPLQYFAQKGFCKVVTYLAMLERDEKKRSLLVTSALPYSKNVVTARLLLSLGADLKKIKANDLLFFCCNDKNVELLKFFMDLGVKLDGGIDDYQKWQLELVEKQKKEKFRRGSDTTPLESLLYRAPSPAEILEKIGVNSDLYQNKSNSEELYISLNEAGWRIGREASEELFGVLNGRIQYEVMDSKWGNEIKIKYS